VHPSRPSSDSLQHAVSTYQACDISSQSLGTGDRNLEVSSDFMKQQM